MCPHEKGAWRHIPFRAVGEPRSRRSRLGVLTILSLAAVGGMAACSSEAAQDPDLNQQRDRIDADVNRVASEIGCTDEPTLQSQPEDALPTVFECTAHGNVVLVAVVKDGSQGGPEDFLGAVQPGAPITVGDGYAWVVSDAPRVGTIVPSPSFD